MPRVVLKREQPGLYVTEDGRYEIGTGVVYEQCEEEHPVRIGREVAQKVREAIQKFGTTRARYADGLRGTPQDLIWAVYNGKKGYICGPGDEHAIEVWHVWDREKDDYVSDAAMALGTKREAVEFLTHHLETLKNNA